jgi:hypothetical protein
MGFNKLIERLYLKVYVGVVTSYSGTDVIVEMSKGKTIQERVSRHFEADENDAISDFIAPYLAESPFYYVAFLNPAADQGALPVGTEKEAKGFIDTATVVTKTQDNSWLVYASKPSLDNLQKEYAQIGADFIFSPFSVIRRFFKDKIDSGTALYVLAEEDAISAAVFADSQLLYAKRLLLPKEEHIDLEEEGSDAVRFSFDIDIEGIEDGLELDDINAIDDLDGLDDLHEIEDLDTLDDFDSFAEDHGDVTMGGFGDEEELGASEEVTLERFGKDYKRFQQIQTALQDYYADPKYDSRFIESVYVADGCNVSDDLKQYLEEELFVKVYVRRIDIAAEVVDLAIAEVNNAS